MKNANIILFLIPFLFSASCTKDPVDERIPQYVIDLINVDAPSMKNSYIGVDTIQKAKVLLPPYYHLDQNKSYPVLYFIHGYGDSYVNNYGIFLKAYNLMVEGTIPEMIIVTVNSNCNLGGTFCVNSPITGNWEDHIANEVVRYMDMNYRTLAKKGSRAIAGFSMGGFGALYLGLRHPDKYSVVYAMSPGVLRDADLNAAYKQWLTEGSFLGAYGAAFSPDTNLPYPHGQIPKFTDTEADNLIVENWYSGFGDFDDKIADYLSGSQRLKTIALDYGLNDYYFWIPRGCMDLIELFDENSIPYEEYKWPQGDHSVNINQVENYLLPFLSEQLEFE
ncbi:MAG: hypothetical protein JW801_13420 [Bacteroidales bacterium]|nr:hypothetical protein [Bacteroidales bacterium]